MTLFGVGILGWFFLVVAAGFVGMGLRCMFGDISKIADRTSMPFTAESFRAASRWMGLSSISFGLGIAGFVLLTKPLFTLGFFSCTVGLVTFLVMLFLSQAACKKINGILERKSNVIDCDFIIHSNNDTGCDDIEDSFDDDRDDDGDSNMAA